MRYAFAILTLALSGVLLILGIGQRTFLAGPTEVTYSTEFDGDAQFAVLSGDMFDAEQGQANAVISGEGAFAAVGSANDVAAWVAPFDHVAFTLDGGSQSLTGSSVAAAPDTAEGDTAADPKAPADTTQAETGDQADALPDPRGSDLWITERSVAKPTEADAPFDRGTVRLPVEADADTAVLIARSSADSPATVSLVWVKDLRTPFAGPLLVSGGVLALVGAVLYLLAVDHDRRGLGPRRGRKGALLGVRDLLKSRFGKRTVERRALPVRGGAAVGLGLALTLGLAGCSPNYWPDLNPEAAIDEPSAEDESALAPVPVTRTQIDRIVADIAKVSNEADTELDASLLESRFTGDALRQRASNYTIRASVPDYAVVPPRLTDNALGYELVQSTEGWPRTMFVTVESESGEAAASTEDSSDAESQVSPSLALIMTQATAHDNYMVSRVVALRGAITMPQAAPAEEGTALLADDLQTLALSPAEVGKAYAAIIAGGTGVDEAEFFDLEGDALIERTGAAWVAQSQAAANAAGQGIVYSVAAAQTDATIVSLSTGVGGALVATTVREDRIEEGAERWKPTPPASVRALSGLTGQQDRIVSVIEHQLLFFVPSKSSSAPIQLLGSSSNLVEARN